MTDSEIEALLTEMQTKCNNAIDKLIPIRQSATNGRKYKYGYIIKKLEVIVGACNRAMEKMPVEFKL